MNKVTPQAKILYGALRARGIYCKMEVGDGHKHVDISIPWAQIDIEVDGLHHYTNADQIMSDLNRSRLSARGDNYDTLHIPNFVIENHLNEVADAIAIVAREWYKSIHPVKSLLSSIKKYLNR